MRIGTRLVIFLAAPLLVLMALFGWLDQERSTRLLREELAKEGRAIARTVQFEMEDAVRDGQIENTRELVDQITGYERVLGLRIFGHDGQLSYQSANLSTHLFDHPEDLAEVLRTRKPLEAHGRIEDRPVVSFILPLSRPGGDLFGAVEILQLESFVEEDARSSRNEVIALTAVMILATTGVILLVTRVYVSRPIADLVRSFRKAGAGDLTARVPVRREEEFGRLAMEFNRMSARLEESQGRLASEQEERRRVEGRLRNAERLASLG
ncbi:MAG TPA: HAMP domain-containing protein, partial [Patescibacteria group bacterium]|nr:HAMP domain-containing protein [Patescibacteria group bacterium]